MKVIGGTGRCGTRWLSGVLRWAGFAAGHEAAHTPDGIQTLPYLQIDVSWLAFTHGVTPDLVIGREPAGCIASLIDCGLFTEGDRYTAAVARCIDLTGDPFVDACRWWCWVNTRPGPVRWRLDQPDQLRDALLAAGIAAPNLDRIVDHFGRDRHPIGNRTTVLGWDDLPDDVLAVAAEWGWT